MTPAYSKVSVLFKNIQAVSPKRASLVIIVILVLLGGMAWVMISEKEQYLVQRNFRLLNLWSQETRAKIASYEKVFEIAAKGLLLSNGNVTLHSPDMVPKNNRLRFLTEKHKPGHMDKSIKENTWKCPLNGVQHSGDPEVFLQGQLCAEGVTKVTLTPRTTDISKKEVMQRLAETPRGSPIIQVLFTKPLESAPPPTNDVDKHTHPQDVGENLPAPPVPFILGPSEDTPKDLSGQIEISGDVDLTHFFTRLTNESPFEKVLVFQSSKENDDSPLIFHTGTQEFSWRSYKEITNRITSTSFLMNLFGSQDDSSKTTTSSSLHPGPNRFLIEVPGNRYEVFSHPFTIPGEKDTNWILVGFVSHDSFQNSYLAISSTMLLTMMFVGIGLVLGIPLFHLKMMGPTDPLRSSHVLALVLSALLGTGLFTYLFLDIAVYWEGKHALKQRLQDSSQTIKDSLFDELKRILFTLDQLDQDPRLKADYQKVIEQTGQPVGQRSVLMENQMKNPCGPSGFIQSELCYPDFLYAFWMDKDGSLRINWVRKRYEGVRENISVLGRDYTRIVLKHSKDLWRLPRTTRPKDGEYRFFLEPIISWNTGLNTVVASMPSMQEDPEQSGEPKQSWVAAMEFKFLSLMDHVVLPPGIGFAVLDSNKEKVLFHSKEGRNLREKFLVETDHNPTLQSLLSARTAGHAEGSYWGNDTSFYTLPLHPLPWSLVVYRNNEMLRSVNLVGLLIAGTLYGLWSIFLYVGVWLLLKWPPVHRKAPWLWPTPDYYRHYVALLKFNVSIFFLGAIGVLVFWRFPTWQLMIALVGIPLISISGGWWIIRKMQNDRKKQNDPIKEMPIEKPVGSYRKGYATLASSILLIFALLPAFTCFSSVFHLEMRLFTQFQLLELFKGVQDTKKLQYIEGLFFCPKPAASTSNNVLLSHGGNPSLGFYPGFFLDTTLVICKGPKEFHEDSPHFFNKLFAVLSQPFLPLLKQTSLRGFIGDSWPSMAGTVDPLIPNKREVLWNTSFTPISLFATLIRDSQAHSSTLSNSVSLKDPTDHKSHSIFTLQLSAPLPFELWFLTGSLPDPGAISLQHLIGYPLMGLAFLVWLILIPKYIANRTVFLSYTPPARFPLDALSFSPNNAKPSNRLIIGFPGQGKTPMATNLEKIHSCVIHIDLKALPPDQWISSLLEKLTKAKIEKVQHAYLLVDHLECQWKNPACNLKKLEFLEILLHRHSSSLHSGKSSQSKSQTLVIELRDIQAEVVSTKILPPPSS